MTVVRKIFRWSTLGYVFFICLFTLLACEVILRIYNPFPFRLKGTDILLPRNQRYIINNNYLPGIDSVIVHTKNSLGFRGPELPADPGSHFSVLTVGGSTTECWYIQEKESWPYLLGKKLENDFQQVWLNNAGISGTSSWAHYLLIRQYVKQLHPKVLFLLAGWNEVGRSELSGDDVIDRAHSTDAKNFLNKNSELYNLVVNIKRHYQYKEYEQASSSPYLITAHHPLLFKSERYNDSLMQAEIPLVAAYKKRLCAIIDTCRNSGILPVLITQPEMTGHGIEPVSGCNLDDFQVTADVSGKIHRALL